jgi:hypothetical protein
LLDVGGRENRADRAAGAVGELDPVEPALGDEEVLDHDVPRPVSVNVFV